MNFQITRKPLPNQEQLAIARQMQPGDCVEGLKANNAVKLRDAIDELHGQGSAVAQLIDLNRYTWTVWRKQ
tara:strand:- start:1839 stop:2051 length:213 start_codon:yes stop_codon:yes gene_type:complete